MWTQRVAKLPFCAPSPITPTTPKESKNIEWVVKLVLLVGRQIGLPSVNFLIVMFLFLWFCMTTYNFFPHVEEEGAQLRLGCQGSYKLDDGSEGEECAVEANGIPVAGKPSQEEVPRRRALSPGLREVRCIRMDVEHHV